MVYHYSTSAQWCWRHIDALNTFQLLFRSTPGSLSTASPAQRRARSRSAAASRAATTTPARRPTLRASSSAGPSTTSWCTTAGLKDGSGTSPSTTTRPVSEELTLDPTIVSWFWCCSFFNWSLNWTTFVIGPYYSKLVLLLLLFWSYWWFFCINVSFAFYY